MSNKLINIILCNSYIKFIKYYNLKYVVVLLFHFGSIFKIKKYNMYFITSIKNDV